MEKLFLGPVSSVHETMDKRDVVISLHAADGSLPNVFLTLEDRKREFAIGQHITVTIKN